MAFKFTGISSSPTGTRGIQVLNIRTNIKGIPIGQINTINPKINSISTITKPTDEIKDIPEVFKLYPVTGSITISRRFNSHPSSSLNIITTQTELNNIREYFKNRDRKIVLYNIPFRIASYSENSLPNNQTEKGRIQVSVQLEGYWQRPLNYSYAYGGSKKLSSVPTTDFPKKIEVTSTKASLSSTRIGNVNYIDVGAFAEKYNIPLKGKDLKLYVGDTSQFSNPAGLQIESSVSSASRDNGYYYLFSHQDSIEVKHWSLEYDSHVINNPIEVSYSQQPEVTVPPTELTWLNLTEEEENRTEDIKQSIPPSFFYNPPTTYTVTDPPNITDVTNAPPNILTIQDLSLNFDISGDKRVLTYTTHQNNIELNKITIVYGFAYTSDQVMKTSGGFATIQGLAAPFWQVIEYTSTIYKYDDSYGYLIGINTQGWRLARFQIETEKLECYTYAGSADSKKRAIRNACLFRKIPIIASEQFLLKQYSDFYKDLGNGEERYVYWDDYDKYGNSVRRRRPNPSYIPPMFIAQSRSYYNSFASYPNPDNIGRTINNTKPRLPPLTTGETRTAITNVTILKSANTNNTSNDGLEQSLGSNYGNSLEDSFVTTTVIQSAQDSNFDNSLQISTPVISSGRPPQAINLPKPYQLINAKPQLPRSNNNTNTKKRGVFSPILYTSPYSPNHIASSTSYNTRTYSKALEAANIEYSMNKTFTEEVITARTLFSPQIKEGDMVLVKYNNEEYKTRVSSVDHAIIIESKDLVVGLTNLNLGVYKEDKYKVGNVFKRYLTQEETENNRRTISTDTNFNPFNKGFTLGDLAPVFTLMSSSKNRGNY